MNLEEEKKLVAVELMGWDLKQTPDNRWLYKNVKNNSHCYWLKLSNWNPQTDRNCWDEIWGKMDVCLYEKYLKNACYVLGVGYETTLNSWKFHTAKPAICWKALITTLKESK